MLFRCENCGGNTVYDPTKRLMVCPHCDSVESHQKVDSLDMHRCVSCGAPLELDEYTSATKCPNCGNYLILEERVQGEYEPKLIIPFKVSKDDAMEALKAEFGKRPFTPDGFLSQASLEKMEGIYVPFFLYDYKSSMYYHGEGTKVRNWTSGNYRYTETSYYDIVRDMTADFERIPVDASIKMDDKRMDLLEPYIYKDMEDYQDKYLSGFFGEKYNMGEAELEPRAEVKVKSDSEDLLNTSISGYSTVRAFDRRIDCDKQKSQYALLPVWEYIFRYHGEDYKYHVNGQTGKVLGVTPTSKGRVIGYGVTVFGLVTLIGFMLRLAFMFM